MARIVQKNTLLSVPEFPEFRPVELDDRQMIEDLLIRDQPVGSEMSFANIYLWRGTYGFGISRIGTGLALNGTEKDSVPVLFPPMGTDTAAAIREMLEPAEIEGTPARVCRLTETAAEQARSMGFTVELDRDNCDYVYLASDLIELPGRKFHRKRNHLAQFAAEHQFSYSRVTADLVGQCLELQETWCDIRDCFIPENLSLAEEHTAVNEALRLLEPLGLLAGAISIDGRVAAFSIGSELNRDTFVIHFEKANPAYPGLYQVINQAFAADAARGYMYVNREQDLGQPGLRKAKESYFPHHLVNKYTVIAPADQPV